MDNKTADEKTTNQVSAKEKTSDVKIKKPAAKKPAAGTMATPKKSAAGKSGAAKKPDKVSAKPDSKPAAAKSGAKTSASKKSSQSESTTKKTSAKTNAKKTAPAVSKANIPSGKTKSAPPQPRPMRMPEKPAPPSVDDLFASIDRAISRKEHASGPIRSAALEEAESLLEEITERLSAPIEPEEDEETIKEKLIGEVSADVERQLARESVVDKESKKVIEPELPHAPLRQIELSPPQAIEAEVDAEVEERDRGAEWTAPLGQSPAETEPIKMQAPEMVPSEPTQMQTAPVASAQEITGPPSETSAAQAPAAGEQPPPETGVPLALREEESAPQTPPAVPADSLTQPETGEQPDPQPAESDVPAAAVLVKKPGRKKKKQAKKAVDAPVSDNGPTAQAPTAAEQPLPETDAPPSLQDEESAPSETAGENRASEPAQIEPITLHAEPETAIADPEIANAGQAAAQAAKAAAILAAKAEKEAARAEQKAEKAAQAEKHRVERAEKAQAAKKEEAIKAEKVKAEQAVVKTKTVKAEQAVATVAAEAAESSAQAGIVKASPKKKTDKKPIQSENAQPAVAASKTVKSKTPKNPAETPEKPKVQTGKAKKPKDKAENPEKLEKAPIIAEEETKKTESAGKNRLGRILTIVLLVALCAAAVVVWQMRGMPPKVYDVTIDAENLGEDHTATVTVLAKKRSWLTGDAGLWYYLGAKTDPETITDAEWVKMTDGAAEISVHTGLYRIFVRDNRYNIMEAPSADVTINAVVAVTFETYDPYLTVGVNYTLTPVLSILGTVDQTVHWSTSDPAVATVKDGVVTGVGNGLVTITAAAQGGRTATAELTVTDLLNTPQIINGKQIVPAFHYTQEEAALLDKILAGRIQAAGYGTRAGVVAAARFLPLELPYKIPYFFENGRLNNHPGRPHIDGEGRYYHMGLYLSTDKYDNITVSTNWGPAIWGEMLMNWQDEGRFKSGVRYPNGLSCSGFVSWAFLNGGVPLGDSGAGDFDYRDDDLCDYGERVELTEALMRSGRVQVGDMIGRDAHIALIVGLDENNIYIAESLDAGVVIAVHGRYDEVITCGNYAYVMLLDDLYAEHNGAGNTTVMWDDYGAEPYVPEKS